MPRVTDREVTTMASADIPFQVSHFKQHIESLSDPQAHSHSVVGFPAVAPDGLEAIGEQSQHGSFVGVAPQPVQAFFQ
jgi:hypothetical protein